MEFKFRNVNDAFHGLVSGIYKYTSYINMDDARSLEGVQGIPADRESSRAGEVFRIPEPVMVTYSHPRERVLFNRARDCNPFFHLYEALWKGSGRDI